MSYNSRVAYRPGFTLAQILVLALVVVLILAALGLAASLLISSPRTQAPDAGAPLASPAPLPTSTSSPIQTQSPASSPTPGGGEASLVPTTTANPLTCLPPDAERSQARVTSVLDAATIQVQLNGQTVTVRYLGVDPAGPGADTQSTALNRSLVEGQTVELVKDIYDADAQGRLLRYVLAGNEFVNYEMVRQGAALAALYPPGIACADTLVAADRLARAEHLGFWAAGQQANLPATPTPAPGNPSQNPPCDCNHAYSCSDFTSQSAAQACYDACGDYRNAGLDADHNGLACENLP